MRLIDADALDNMLSEAQAECKRNGGNFRFGVLSNIRENIKEQPTIDAIPVEWLKAKMRECESEKYNKPWQCYEFILRIWQKEQEAKDG